MQCTNNLKQMGLSLFNYESGNGAFPPACKSINLTTSPPSVMFPDTGFSVQARVACLYRRGYAVSTHLTSPMNTTMRAAAISRAPLRSLGVLCLPINDSGGNPRHRRKRPQRFSLRKDSGHRLRLHGLRTVGLHRHQRSSMAGSPPVASVPRTIVPYRNKTLAAKGLLKDGKTAIAEISDGTSNTIAILECAGRDERFVSQFLESLYPVVRGLGPAGYANGARHRFWRWADPGSAFGTSGQPNNKGVPTNEGVPWPTTVATAGNQAGPNEEPYSFHPGGINALFGDGSVHFLKNSVNLVALRSLLTIAGGETISSDAY